MASLESKCSLSPLRTTSADAFAVSKFYLLLLDGGSLACPRYAADATPRGVDMASQTPMPHDLGNVLESHI